MSFGGFSVPSQVLPLPGAGIPRLGRALSLASNRSHLGEEGGQSLRPGPLLCALP